MRANTEYFTEIVSKSPEGPTTHALVSVEELIRMLFELKTLRDLQQAVTNYCEPFRPNKPTISIDTIRAIVLRTKRRIESP